MKRIAIFWIAVIMALTLPSFAAAKLVTITDGNGAPGGTVIVQINVDDISGIAGYNINFDYDQSVLTAESAAVGVDFAGYNLIPNLTTAGEVRLGMIGFTGNTGSGSGQLATVTFSIKDTAYKNSALSFTLISLKNESGGEIAGTTSVDGTVTVTGVTVVVNLTADPSSDVVAGQAVQLTAGVTVNGNPLTLTSTDDITFARTGTGTFGTKSIDSGNVVVNYTTAALVESATVTATEAPDRQ